MNRQCEVGEDNRRPGHEAARERLPLPLIVIGSTLYAGHLVWFDDPE